MLHNVIIGDSNLTLEEGRENLIMPEVLIRKNIDDIILKFENKLISDGDKPDQFSVLNIAPIPKSGNLGLTNNRIRPKIGTFLRGNQNGFRSGCSTTAQVCSA